MSQLLEARAPLVAQDETTSLMVFWRNTFPPIIAALVIPRLAYKSIQCRQRFGCSPIIVGQRW
jgi:hypothetical protein